jgi:uncharacterized protein YdhG (YjbR/CyaY superfamily)
MAKPRKKKLRENAKEATKELREKVKSKMDVAKFFAGFITLLVGFVLKDSGIHSTVSKAGIVFLSASLAFCVVSVFAYDCLLMPREYWTVISDDESEDSFQDNLQEQMVTSWRWLFVPAVLCFGIGFLLVLASALDLKFAIAEKQECWSWGVLLIIALAVPICLFKLKGPKIYD